MRATLRSWMLIAMTLAAAPAAAQCPASTPAQGAPPPAPLPVFPASNWWNLDISGAPVDARSAAIINYLGPTSALRADFGSEVVPGGAAIRGLPYAVVDGTQPKLAVEFVVEQESDGVDPASGYGVPFYPIPAQAIDQTHWIEGGLAGNDPTYDGTQRRLILIDCTNRHLYELSGVSHDAAQGWKASYGAFYHLDGNVRRPAGWINTYFADLALFPSLVRYDEASDAAREDLGHALRITVPRVYGFVFPASHAPDWGTLPDAPPQGARLRLRAQVGGADPVLRTADPAMRRIFRTLQRYGAIVDNRNGTGLRVAGTFDTRWNNAQLDAAFALLHASDFEVVQLGWNPATPPPTLSVAGKAVAEGNAATALYLTATLSRAAPGPVTFNASTIGGSAVAGSDFVALAATGLVIPAGQLSRTFKVDLLGDTTVEANEAFQVNLTLPVGATVGNPATIRLLNDDGPTLSVADASITEGNSSSKVLSFAVTLSSPSPSWSWVDVTVANGSAQAPSDYIDRYATVYFAPGEVAQGFKVAILGDTKLEGNETLIATLARPVGATVFDDRGVGTIVNDDGPTLSIADVATTEGSDGARQLTFTARLSQAAGTQVIFDAATANGTATAGTDYVALVASDLTIPAGQLSKAIDVTMQGDTIAEGNENLHLDLKAVTGATVADARGTALLLNDDGPTLSIADVETTEGASGTKVLTFTVALSEAAAVPVRYNIATSDGTAVAGSDYVAQAIYARTIPAGQLAQTFAVVLNGDTAGEYDEAFTVALSGAYGASILDAKATGRILDDDGITLSIGDVETTEGDAGTKVLDFTVRLSRAAAVPVSYTIATGNGTAQAGSDYVARALVGETIPAGQLTRHFAVVVKGDAALEANESFAVTLGAPTNAGLDDDRAVGGIRNDDGPTLTINDRDTNETWTDATPALAFTVSLSQAASVPVTFDVATHDITTTAGSDYTAVDLTGLVIPAGQLSRTVVVTVLRDLRVEPNETFAVRIDNSAGATIQDAEGIGTLRDDDGPYLSIDHANAMEFGKQVQLRAYLNDYAIEPVTFSIATSDGNARAGSDYTATTKTGITIPAGARSAYVTVPILQDTLDEPVYERFWVNITEARGTNIFRTSSEVLIQDDD